MVFFSIFNVVFNEPFYIFALVNFSTSVNLFALVVQCGALGSCIGLLFYYVFSILSVMNMYVSVPLLVSMRLSTFLFQ
jgi:hypothetical protein